MKFSHARKAVRLIRNKSLKKDIQRAIAQIEERGAKNKKAGGREASSLIRLAFALRETLPAKARFSLANGVFEDAKTNRFVHEFERAEDRECTADGCTKVHEGWYCLRNTDTDDCMSGPR
jgi:hypothetical protein